MNVTLAYMCLAASFGLPEWQSMEKMMVADTDSLEIKASDAETSDSTPAKPCFVLGRHQRT